MITRRRTVISAAAVVASPALARDPLLDVYRPALPGGKLRTHFIAAEEVAWDYAPSGRDEMMGHAFMPAAAPYVSRDGGGIGRVHTKALYVAYTDDTFSTKTPRAPEWQHTGLLGPVLRAEVGDVIRVIFRNRTRQPCSIHPHGVFYTKADEGAGGNDGTSATEKRDDAVPPGETQVYVWQVPPRAGPGPRDPSSLLWLYHSRTDRPRDTNAGLIGAILVTRRGMAGPVLRPRDVDREFITLWKIFNENRSWYLDEDAANAGFAPAARDSRFTQGNLKAAVNGYIFANLPLDTMTMRTGERVRWYMAALGGEVDAHAVHWHGNSVVMSGQRLDVVPLLPAQHAVADMVPDNPGIWMIHCHVDEHLEAGMSARYRVLPKR
jgi:FtsP/CotA-like multicopper oxidase with cupredoxin domain